MVYSVSMRAKLIVVSVLALGLALPAVAWRYRIYDLGSVDGFSRAWGVTESGMVVGAPAFFWTEQRGMWFAQPRFFAGQADVFNCVNELGEAAGDTTWHVGGRIKTNQPFFWSPQTGFTLLPFLTGYVQGYCYGVNDRSQVVGTMFGPAGQAAFFWSRPAGTVDMGRFDPRFGAIATDVNEGGEACGTAGNSPNGFARAFRWTQGTGLVDLGVLPTFTESFGEAINDQGEIVGTCFKSGTEVTFRARRGEQMTNALPLFPGFVAPYDINEQGWFCGVSHSVFGQFAALCLNDGTVIDIAANADGGTGGLSLIQATGLNERGDVCGTAERPDRRLRAFFAKRLD